MKIAIVASSPIPFGVGGAEKLWWGIQEYINKYTTNQCELIKIPVNESSFWGLIDAYKAFYDLDLSYFDMVISGKYPAWMIKHQNHHIYMLHCLRGFYDCSHLVGLDKQIETKDARIINILNKLNSNNSSIDEVLNLIYDLKKESSIDERFFEFPGVFIKNIVKFFDKKAMENIQHFSAISQTVINRKEYFPKDMEIKKIYPPSNLDNFKNISYDYFFVISRIDTAKRIDMIVDAYMKSNSNIPLKIAGTGPLLNDLKQKTKDDLRIEFLGFVSDIDLIEYYAKAYAVIFIPYDEDYGLITIEAMMSEKAVITFEDSGGVLEFVEDEQTGLISKANIKELTKKIDYLSINKDKCLEMGKNAKKRVEEITWKNLATQLLDTPAKDKITVVTTYPIYPPRGGGQNRIFYLYKEIAKKMIVDIVCLVHESERFKKSQIAPNLFEIRVPKSQSHALKEWKIEEKAEIPITDIAMLFLYDETPQFIEEVKKSCSNSKYVISSHPYTYTLLKKYVNIPLIHESHNVEYNLKKQMLNDTSHNEKLLVELYNTEKRACEESLFTIVCSNEDVETFKTVYKLEDLNTFLVPNGVDLESVSYVSPVERVKIKDDLSLTDTKIVLFIGSYHKPNIDAVFEIFKLAEELEGYSFIILGSVYKFFENIKKPLNVGFAGIVTDEEKESFLSITDIAINPMLSGSGTNLKMLDYMANGIPVISTFVGARGLDIPDEYIVKVDIKDFKNAIYTVLDKTNVVKSRRYMEENFSWKVIGDKFNKILQKEVSLI